MNDRLADLGYVDADEEEYRSSISPTNKNNNKKSSGKKKQKKYDSDDDDDNDNNDNGQSGSNVNEMGQGMQEYYDQVQSIRTEIDNISLNIKKLKKVYSVILNATDGKEMQKNKNMVNEKISETSVIIKKCQKLLKDMKDKTQKMKDEDDGTGSNAVIRIREQQHVQITREFMDVMQEYQDVQEEYKDNYQSRMKRSILVANPDVSDEQVQAMLENPNFQPTDVFKADMLAETDKHTLDTMYAEVAETHKDILKLEVSLRELHQLFVDFAALVEAQDEMFDNIEHNVTHAREYIESGIKNLKKAKKWEKRSRKCIMM